MFGARSARCYNWAKNRLFSTGLLVSVCQQKVLVRSGDEFLAPVIPVFSSDEAYSLANYQDLIALECEPIKQGIISVNTSIVITEIDESRQFNSRAVNGTQENINESFRNELINPLPEPFILSEFASKLNNLSLKSVLSSESNVSNVVPVRSFLNNEEEDQNVLYLRPVIIPTVSTHTRATVNYLTYSDNQCEVQIRVGVTKATLKRLRAFSGSWVVVSIPHEEIQGRENEMTDQPGLGLPEMSTDTDDKTESHDSTHQPLVAPNVSFNLAQVFAIDQKLFGMMNNSTDDYSGDVDAANRKKGRNEDVDLIPDDDVMYLSPQLWFNLQLHPSRLIQPDMTVSVRVSCKEVQETFSYEYICMYEANIIFSAKYLPQWDIPRGIWK